MFVVTPTCPRNRLIRLIIFRTQISRHDRGGRSFLEYCQAGIKKNRLKNHKQARKSA